MGRIPKAEKEKALMYLKKKNGSLNPNEVNDQDNDIMIPNTDDQSRSSSNNDHHNYDYEESDVVSDDGGITNDGNNSNNTASFEEFYSQYHQKSTTKANNNSHSFSFQTPKTNKYNLNDDKSNDLYENNKDSFLENINDIKQNFDVDKTIHGMKFCSNKKALPTNLNDLDEDKSDDNSNNIGLESNNLKLLSNHQEIRKDEEDKENQNLNESQNKGTSVSSQIMKYSFKALEESLKNKSNNVMSFHDLNFNRGEENYQSLSSLFELLKMHKTFQNSNLTINRYHSTLFSPNPELDYSYHIILSLISDKIYQSHIENNERVAFLYERALRLVKENVKIFDGHDATLHEVWSSLLESIPPIVKNFISFAKEVPGLNELSSKDFTTIVNNRLFDYFMLKHSPLFIDGESYMMLPNNIHYSREWMNKVVGEEMTNALFEFCEEFNSLNMTTKEIALLLPFVLTVPDDAFEDSNIISNLHEYYYRALLYEFDLNRRNNSFITKWRKLIEKMPELNELQINKIGSLTPKYFVKFVELYRVPFQNLLHRLERLGDFCKIFFKNKKFRYLLNFIIDFYNSNLKYSRSFY